MSRAIRYAAPADFEVIYAIERACFPTPWEADVLAHDLSKNPCARYLLILEGEQVVGYGCLWLLMEEAHLMSVAILPEFRRAGAGEALMRALIQAAADGGARFMELECRRGNQAAQALYHKLGFLRVGCRKGYYEDTGEDAFVYALISLPPGRPDDDPFLNGARP